MIFFLLLKTVLIIIFIFFLIIILFLLYETEDNESHLRTIKKDGFVVIRSPFNKQEVLSYLPEGYMFIDYIYEIRGCSISTFHRDITSSKYLFETVHPVYTYITYHNTGRLLSIAPNSHRTIPFLWDRALTIRGFGNTGVLFNCDLIHAGAINEFGDARFAIQYKICHQEDLYKLTHLIGVNKIKKGKCSNSYYYEYFLRKLSLLLPYVFNHLLTNLLQEKPEKDSFFDIIISKFYIGDFYL